MGDNDIYTIVFVCIIGLVAVMLFVGLLYIAVKVVECRRLLKRRKNFISQSNFCESEKNLLERLAERIYVIYYSYALHTTIYMFCNICGMLFTISTFVLSFSPANDYKVYSIAFLSMFFVIIIIYTKPQRRSTQYLLAWRKLTNAMNILLYGTLPLVDPSSTSFQPADVNEGKTHYIIKLMNDVENSFTADEDNI